MYKHLEIAFLILSLLVMFFWFPTYKTFLADFFVKTPLISKYAQFFGTANTWRLFSDPGPEFSSIKATILFTDGSSMKGYCLEDPLLINVIGIREHKHRVKYFNSIMSEEISANYLLEKIVQGFRMKNMEIKKIKLEVFFIFTDNYPNYKEKKFQTLIAHDFSKKQGL